MEVIVTTRHTWLGPGLLLALDGTHDNLPGSDLAGIVRGAASASNSGDWHSALVVARLVERAS